MLPTAGGAQSSDGDLVRMAQCGLKSAFDRLVARHHPRLRYHLRTRLADRHDIEDACQETWYRVYRDLDRFSQKKGSFVNWLRGYADNVARELNRRRRQVQLLSTEDVEPMAAELDALVGNSRPPDAAATVEAMDAIRGLAQLRGSLRAPLLAHMLQDAGPTELSAMFGITAAAAKQRLYLARRLARQLGEHPDGKPQAVRPLLGEGIFEVARLCLSAGSTERAKEWFHHAIEFDGRSVNWIKDVGHLTTRPDVDQPLLQSVLHAALQRRPGDQRLAYEYANMVRNSDGYNAAHPHYEAAWQINTGNSHAAVLLAVSHIVRGEHQQAWELMERYLGSIDDPDVPMAAAEALAPLGRANEVRALMEPMLQRVEGSPPDQVLPGRLPDYSRYYTAGRYKIIGHCRTEIGDLADARDAYQKAIATYRGMSEIGEVQQIEIEKCERGLIRCDRREKTGERPQLGLEDY